MKLEVGKTYRTRDGRKAILFLVTGVTEEEEIHYARFEGYTVGAAYFKNGRCFGEEEETADDLVAEWED